MVRTKRGFTLIELIIVIVIIGILASISAPMMQGVKVKAICTEGVTALETIRIALRVYHAEYKTYPEMYDFVSNYSAQFSDMGLPIDNLTGTYFGKECYFIDTTLFTAISVIANVADNSAPRHTEAAAIVDDPSIHGGLNMYLANGYITQINLSRSGYDEDQIM